MRLGGESASLLMDTNLTVLVWGNRIIERKVFKPYIGSYSLQARWCARCHITKEEEISSLVTFCNMHRFLPHDSIKYSISISIQITTQNFD